MKEVLFILCAVACFSFTTVEEICPPDSTLITSSCDSQGSCWTTIGSSPFFPYFTMSTPSIDEEADIRVELESRCGMSSRETYLSPIAH